MALNVLVYSDDRSTREQVLLALGHRPATDLAELQYLECATEPAVRSHLFRGRRALAKTLEEWK